MQAAELLRLHPRSTTRAWRTLVEIYRAPNGEHPDWQQFRRAMVDDGRVPLHLHVERVYGMAR